MSQFSLPGIQKQYKGSDYRGTAGLHAGASGGIASRVVVFSELEAQQQAFDAAVSVLETAFEQADASDTAAWQSATSNLSRQLNNVAQGVASRMAVAARWEGSLASLQAAMAVNGSGFFAIPQSAGAVTIAPVNADFATNEDYYTQIKSNSWQYLVLVHNITTASETGLYCVSNGTLQKFSPFFPQLRDGALIFVDRGDKANTFWSIADPTIVTANNVVIPSLIPFGAFTQLQTDPNGFLTIAANELNAALDGAYFSVVNGELTMTPAFVARVTSLESGLATAQTNISTLQSGLAAETTARQSADTAQDTAIAGKASAASLASEITARTSADTALQTAIDTNATAISSEITARTSADTALQTAIDTNATAISTEVTARTAASAAQLIDIAARVTAQQLAKVFAHFMIYSHPVKSLIDGVFSTVNGLSKTTFYVPLDNDLEWSISRYSETAAPYMNVQVPSVSYVSERPNPLGGANLAGSAVKIEFYHETQIADSTVDVYLTRHYRDLGANSNAYNAVDNVFLADLTAGVYTAAAVVAAVIAFIQLGITSNWYKLVNGNLLYSPDGVTADTNSTTYNVAEAFYLPSNNLVYVRYLDDTCASFNGTNVAAPQTEISLVNYMGTRDSIPSRVLL